MARILLCSSELSSLDQVQGLLDQSGHESARHVMGNGEPDASHELAIVEASNGTADQAHSLCRLLRIRSGDRLIPILFLSSDSAPAARLAGLDSGADAYLLQPFEPGEFRAQVDALLRMQETQARLDEKTAELQRVNRRLHQAYQRIDQDHDLARRVQQNMLPRTLPELSPARFAVHYRPCGRVGGDFHDVFRVDETHVGFYVADAMGHGTPASLLAIFLKQALRPKEIVGSQHRLVPPDEVLQRLNDEPIAQANEPFVTMVYGLFDCARLTLQFARAGHPLPLHLSAGREPRLCQAHGPLLGTAGAIFPLQTQQLQPGDKVLFYSDGIDRLTFDGKPGGVDSLRACAAQYRDLPVHDFIPKLSTEMTSDGVETTEDVTILALEVT